MQSIPWSTAADPARRVGHTVEFHARIGSTNDRARAALGEPGGEGRAIMADLQTAGRGRRGRRWLSPPGVNLMISVGLRPALPASHAWWLGAAAALAVRQAAEAAAALWIRWPNDLVVRDGRKVAGLLLETAAEGERLSEAVIGIGINVNWPEAEMPAEIASGATSLMEAAGQALDRGDLLARLLSALDSEVGLVEEGISPLPRLRDASWLDGRPVRVAFGPTQVSGTATGIADDGSLIVATAGGPVAIGYGEVIGVTVSAPVPA